MLAAQSPISGNQIRRPKPTRTPLQLKNSPATATKIDTNLIKSKQNTPKWIEITVPTDDYSNKENIPPPQLGATPAKIEQIDASLAEELSAIRQKLERLRIEKEKTEKLLSERDKMLDLQMNELLQRGEEQKQLEIEVDRLFRLKELKLSCMVRSYLSILFNALSSCILFMMNHSSYN